MSTGIQEAPATATNLSDEDRLEKGVGTLTIQLDGNPAQDTLQYIAGLIEQGMTNGYYPTWEVSA